MEQHCKLPGQDLLMPELFTRLQHSGFICVLNSLAPMCRLESLNPNTLNLMNMLQHCNSVCVGNGGMTLVVFC